MYIYRIFMYKLLLINVSVSLIVSEVQLHMAGGTMVNTERPQRPKTQDKPQQDGSTTGESPSN